MNDLTFTDKGFSDYVSWQFEDRKTVKRINNLLEDIKRNGAMQGITTIKAAHSQNTRLQISGWDP